ncbi:helicase C-terminal domain-containing protein [Pseudomonadota bacterium]
MDTYIALDIETTGFDAENDQVIEVAAIKFQGDKVIDTFDTLVNPNIHIPTIITHITSIKDEDLVDAPAFDDIKDDLMKFIGSYPIIGHNIDFDITFLKKKGLPIKNPLFDTLQLSTILLPDLPSYSLDTLTLLLNIEHKNKHRALSDTVASQKLFLLLENKINDIDVETYAQISELIKKSHWELKTLFLKKRNNGAGNKKPDEQIENGSLPPNFEFTNEVIDHFYSPQGPLAKQIAHYEERASQKEITNKIIQKFEEAKNLVVEAGAGTGKTIAYTLASIIWGQTHDRKVVISTYSKTLQEQIIGNDIPLLTSSLENLRINATVLKGRRNYISLERLRRFLDKEFFEDFEVTLLIKILIWLKHTQTGDFEEVAIQGKEFSILEDLCCSQFNCIHEDAKYRAGCYAVRARQKAENSDIIIINHALLIQDSTAISPILPEYDYLIIDEAHHLEKVTTDNLTISLSVSSLLKPFEKLFSILGHLNEINDLIKESIKVTDALASKINIFFGFIGIYMENHLEPSEFQYYMNLKIENTDNAEWFKVKESAKSIIELGNDLIKKAHKGAENLETITKTALSELTNQLLECESRLQNANEVFSDNFSNRINWIFKGSDTGFCLKSAPLNVGDYLKTLIYENKNSTIMTSATLTIEKSFAFIRDQLSLDESFEALSIPSHFDYPDQVKLIIPEDLPAPATEGYFLECADLIEQIIRKNGGRTLVLFTSKKALTATYLKIAPALKESKINIYAQHVTGGRGKILEHFKADPEHSAIFGTASFWQGIDLPGNLITCVIIQKLPFDPPNDPIILSRSKKYTDSFNDYQLPQAIMKFKQGFGRLIRSSKDKGTILILDSRIIQKSYGLKFLSSLPDGIQIEHSMVDNTVDYI